MITVLLVFLSQRPQLPRGVRQQCNRGVGQGSPAGIASLAAPARTGAGAHAGPCPRPGCGVEPRGLGKPLSRPDRATSARWSLRPRGLDPHLQGGAAPRAHLGGRRLPRYGSSLCLTFGRPGVGTSAPSRGESRSPVALGDLLGRCGVLADDHGERRVSLAGAPGAPPHGSANTPVSRRGEPRCRPSP